MTRLARLLVLVGLALVATAPRAHAQKPPPKAAVGVPLPRALGAWAYVIVMPDREPTGALTVQPATDGYKGTITTDAERRLTAVDLGRTTLRAVFEQPGFGTVELAATVGDDGTLAGTVTASGSTFPLTATRAD